MTAAAVAGEPGDCLSFFLSPSFFLLLTTTLFSLQKGRDHEICYTFNIGLIKSVLCILNIQVNSSFSEIAS